MGIFDRLKKKPVAKERTLLPEEIELQRRLKEQDDFIAEKNKAEQAYKDTGDSDALLAFYRGVFSENKTPVVCGSWMFNYPELLIKEKKFDEAWGVLNLFRLLLPDKVGRISDLQYKILKAENKHHTDAIFHLMVSYLYRVKGTTDPIGFYLNGEKERFLKKAKPLAKKASLNDSDLEAFSSMIEWQIDTSRYSDKKLHEAYSTYLKNKTEN